MTDAWREYVFTGKRPAGDVPVTDTDDPAQFANKLRNAADWINHQMDPVPDWDGLLTEAADRYERLAAELATADDRFAEACQATLDQRLRAERAEAELAAARDLATSIITYSERWENYGWDAHMDDTVDLARRVLAGTTEPADPPLSP